MSYLALYRKYRPTELNDVVGQNKIITILKNSIKLDKISHAYLFYGPRGTGKTTIAKAFAKIVNCSNSIDLNPCNSCDSCVLFNNNNNVDIIEIDAASNNGVEEIRSIRDNVNLAPTISKYKVYIIDEVHMLSLSAFNALLKTLEEPPKHVIFILATTEFYKVPETIVSRCQCLEFSRISNENLVSRLKYIASNENIIIDDETVNAIALYSNGGLRDAIGMLDKLSLVNKSISLNDFYDLKGIVSENDLKNFLESILFKDIKETLEISNKCFNNGVNINLFLNQLQSYIKNIVINSISSNNCIYDLDKLYNILDIITDSIVNSKKVVNYNLFFDIMIIKIYKKIGNININSEKNSNVNKIFSNDVILENESKIDVNIVCNENIISVNNQEIIDNSTSIVSNESVINDTNNISSSFYDNKKIIVNNALATGNKTFLSNIKDKWSDLNNYLYNNEFSSVISYLLDGNVRVASEKYIIISLKYDSAVDNADNNIEKIKLLLSLVTGQSLSIAFISDDEWNNIKNKFINDKKNGIIYNVKDEIIINSSDNNINDLEHSDVYNNAVLLFGDDIVEER